MGQLAISGEVVHVSREKLRFGKNRVFVTIASHEGDRHTVKLSKDQIREFDIEDHVQNGKKIYAEIETFKKGEEYTLPDGKKAKYEGDGRKLISMTGLSSFELRKINATQSRDLLADIEEPDLQSSLATVLAGLK